MKIVYYSLICLICVFFACQRKEQQGESKNSSESQKAEETPPAEPLEAVRWHLARIEKNLPTAHNKVVDYQSSKDMVEGKLSAFEKEGQLLKLIDESNTKVGLIRIEYFFDKKGDLVSVALHRQTHSKDKDEMIFAKEEQLFLHQNQVIRITERVKTFKGQEKVDMSQAPEVTLEVKATEANAKAKRHKREADMLIFFLNSGKTYDEFFN